MQPVPTIADATHELKAAIVLFYSLLDEEQRPLYAGPAAGDGPWKKKLRIVAEIEILLEHISTGDPITRLKWSRRATGNIAQLLQQAEIGILPNTVARLPHEMNCSLRVNHKKLATDSSPDRDLQFEHLSTLRTRFQRRRYPIISVDTKKREPVANSQNPGTRWDHSPGCVTAPTPIGAAIPYGIYDFLAHRRLVASRGL